jgi:hypothetical protein
VHFDPDLARSLQQLRRVVDADDGCSARGDFLRQRSVATAYVEDALTRFRVEQVERSRPELRYEAPCARVVRGVPAARRGDGRAQRVFTQSR